jgi:hypothetical protein
MRGHFLELGNSVKIRICAAARKRLHGRCMGLRNISNSPSPPGLLLCISDNCSVLQNKQKVCICALPAPNPSCKKSSWTLICTLMVLLSDIQSGTIANHAGDGGASRASYKALLGEQVLSTSVNRTVLHLLSTFEKRTERINVFSARKYSLSIGCLSERKGASIHRMPTVRDESLYLGVCLLLQLLCHATLSSFLSERYEYAMYSTSDSNDKHADA